MYSAAWSAGAEGAGTGAEASTGDESILFAWSLPLEVPEKSGLKLSLLSTGGNVGAEAMVAVLYIVGGGGRRTSRKGVDL